MRPGRGIDGEVRFTLMTGDGRATIAALLPLLRRHEDRAFRSQPQGVMKDWWELLDARGTSTDTPMKPQVVAHAVSEALASDAVVCGDSGTVTTWSARQIKVRKGRSYSFSGDETARWRQACPTRSVRTRHTPAGRWSW